MNGNGLITLNERMENRTKEDEENKTDDEDDSVWNKGKYSNFFPFLHEFLYPRRSKGVTESQKRPRLTTHYPLRAPNADTYYTHADV